MARRSIKKLISGLFNEKKEETIKDFGEVTIADSWDKVTLKMFQEFMRMSDSLTDEKGEKRQMTIYDVLPVFSNLTREKIELLPVEFVDSLMARLSFTEFRIPEKKPSPKIKIGDDIYMINIYESMREKEYEDCMLVTKNDPYDYAGILAITCRKVIDEKIDDLSKKTWYITEPYTSEFANEIYEHRKEYWENMPITEIMPLLAFFLIRWAELNPTSATSLPSREQLDQFVKDIETSLPDMDLPKWRLMLCKIQLRRLKKLIKCI